MYICQKIIYLAQLLYSVDNIHTCVHAKLAIKLLTYLIYRSWFVQLFVKMYVWINTQSIIGKVQVFVKLWGRGAVFDSVPLLIVCVLHTTTRPISRHLWSCSRYC